MSKFSYRAINESGRPIRGTLTADSENELAQKLAELGYELLDAREIDIQRSKMASVFTPKVKTRDLIQMFVHLEQLQKAGVPLLESLADIRDTTETARLRDVMTEVHREVSEGRTLSEALSTHPSIFQPIFISLIGSGEETGNLTNSFEQVIRHLKWTDAMDVKVKKATRYPKILIVVVIGVIALMMGYVVPEVVGFLDNIGQELPGATRALMATSKFFNAYAIYIGIIMFLIYFGIKVGRLTSDSFRYHTDAIALRMPVLGPVTRKIGLSRFCQTFGVLYSSGLEILKCLSAAQQTAGNLILVEALGLVRERVQEGSPISGALNTSGEFPSLVVRMVKIGEESGNLTEVLSQVAEFYDRDVNEAVDGMIAMIEPALTVILGGMILWIAVAVFGPVYDSFGKMGM